MPASRAEQIAERIRAVPAGDRRAALVQILGELSTAEAEALLHEWALWSRPEQRTPEGDWTTWLYLGGRGTGKTRTGAEFVRERVDAGFGRIGLVAPTAADVRDIMVEGESGLLSIFPRDERPRYEPSKRRVTFHTGAIATTYSADEPERLRGPQHDTVWADELAAWRYATDAWDNISFGLRLGPDPKALATTTPKPKKIIRDLIGDPTCHLTRGSTYDNIANLAPAFVAKIISKYEGTRLGRQEIWAELLEDVPGALWTRTGLEARRLKAAPVHMTRIVIAIDPPISSTEGAAEAGINVSGLGEDDNGYVLQDRSKIASPGEWAREAIAAYHHWRADVIVAEKNQGGEMVEHTIRLEDPSVNVKVIQASKGKALRAEPIAALFDPNKVYDPKAYLVGTHEELEDQLCTWVPGEPDEDSPDRLDAMVYALTELMLAGDDTEEIVEYDAPVRISRY